MPRSSSIRFHRALATLVLGVALATPAAAELAAWDQAKVSALTAELEGATKALNDTFYKEPTPTGAGNRRAYYRLKQNVRRLRSETRQLASALGEGAGREETLNIYEHMMMTVRQARNDATQVFLTHGVQERASAVRGLLNQLSPYYDPDAVPLQAPAR
jgi:hypothetical protein